MTGPSAAAAAAEAGRPDVADRQTNEAPHAPRQRYLRVLGDGPKLQALYNGPPPRMEWDGTCSTPPPAEALQRGRYALPLLIEAPIAPAAEPEMQQMIAAEQHARRVSLGLCWQEEEQREVFDESVFRFGDADLPPEAVWTSDQKYQFIELLGRRSAANLASIAETIGKPLLDCELYLDLLKCGAQEVSVNLGDIPEAEEAGERQVDPTITESEDLIFGAIDDRAECLLRLDRLEVRMDHSFSADSVAALVDAVKQRVRTWIEVTDKRDSYNHPRFLQVEELVNSAPRQVLGFARPDEELRMLQPPQPGTGPLLYDSDVGEEAIVVTDSEDEDL